jgi:hypothetical protein
MLESYLAGGFLCPKFIRFKIQKVHPGTERSILKSGGHPAKLSPEQWNISLDKEALPETVETHPGALQAHPGALEGHLETLPRSFCFILEMQRVYVET